MGTKVKITPNHKEIFNQYQTCVKKIRMPCDHKKCRDKHTILQSICFFKLYSKIMCLRIKRAVKHCGNSSSSSCRHMRSAESKHCGKQVKRVKTSACKNAKKRFSTCYQVQIAKCHLRKKNECHTRSVRLCRVEYRDNLARCRTWARLEGKKRCGILERSLKFCSRVRCYGHSGAFCRLKVLKCR